MKTFFLCWDNTNFKLYLIRTNLSCPLSPSAKFLHFQNRFLFVWKSSPAACSNAWPQFKVSFDTNLQFNMREESTKKDEEKKNFCRRISLDIPKFWTKSLFAWNVSYVPLWQNPLRANWRKLLFNAIISPKKIFYHQRKIM